MISNVCAVGHAPRSPLIAAAMSMTRVGTGQTGAAVNLWLSSQHPKKAETARLPKNKPIRFGIPQVKTPASSVLIDRLTHAITFSVVSSELSAHAKTLHTSPVEVIMSRGDEALIRVSLTILVEAFETPARTSSWSLEEPALVDGPGD
jgi:hypothetical protein